VNDLPCNRNNSFHNGIDAARNRAIAAEELGCYEFRNRTGRLFVSRLLFLGYDIYFVCTAIGDQEIMVLSGFLCCCQRKNLYRQWPN